MSTMIRTLVLGLGLASLGMAGGTGLTALASPGGPGAQRARPCAELPGMRLVHGMSQLDLTDAQQDMLDALRADMKAEMKALHAERKAEREALKEAMLSGSEPDRAALHGALDEHASERLALAHTFLDRVLDIRDTLSPEQLTELQEMAAEHEARREKGEARRGAGASDGMRPRRR